MLNICFIGHVDSGKSTCAGHLLVQTGQISDHQLTQLRREAAERHHSSWFYAYLLDQNEEERDRGRTVEVGRAHFTYRDQPYTIWDVPGHRSYLTEILAGVAQADLALLVVSARAGEFEAGFESGATQEYALLARLMGVRELLVVVNKMDQAEWSETRYQQIVLQLNPYLKSIGYRAEFMALSAQTGENLMIPYSNWGSSLLERLANWPRPKREVGSARLPVFEKFSEAGALQLTGKLETGSLRKGDSLYLNDEKIQVLDIRRESKVEATEEVLAGEVVTLKVALHHSVQSGDILSTLPFSRTRSFLVQAQFFESGFPCGKSPCAGATGGLVTLGYQVMAHSPSTALTSVTVEKIISEIDRSGKVLRKNPIFLRPNTYGELILKADPDIFLTLFSQSSYLGRLVLRQADKTVGWAKVIRLAK